MLNPKLKKFLLREIKYLLIFAVIFCLLYFFFGKKGGALYFFKAGKLVAVQRDYKGVKPIPAIALEFLLAGPNAEEAQKGYYSQIPSGVRMLGVLVENKIARANFSRELEEYGGGAARVQGMVRQIVYTLTEFSQISKARILIEGQEREYLGAEGYVIDHPLGRKDLR
jgi:germination protein M